MPQYLIVFLYVATLTEAHLQKSLHGILLQSYFELSCHN